MKFTPNHPAGSLPHLDTRARILAAGCRHCHSQDALGPHGYLGGNAATGSGRVTRGLRFFCSNRHSKQGCGRTFSVHWDTVIPFSTLRTVQLLALMRAIAATASIHGGWCRAGLTMAVSGAYRWVARWLRGVAALRTRLVAVAPPPCKTDGLPDPFTLRHLTTAFPDCPCAIAAFQSGLQVPVTG